jgi:hypothetical protein
MPFHLSGDSSGYSSVRVDERPRAACDCESSYGYKKSHNWDRAIRRATNTKKLLFPNAHMLFLILSLQRQVMKGISLVAVIVSG